MSFRLPSFVSARAGLFLRLGPERIAKLSAVLRSSSPDDKYDVLTDGIAAALGVDESEAQSIMQLLAVVTSGLSAGVSVAEMIEGFEADWAEKQIPEAEAKGVIGALTDLFNDYGPALSLLTEAGELEQSVSASFLNCRILTDARPVFGKNHTEPRAFILLHNLKIDYSDAAHRREFYVTMNPTELAKLKSTIDRAMEKEKHLRAALAKTELPCVPGDENGDG